MLSRLPPLLLVLLPSQALDTGEQISRLYRGWGEGGGVRVDGNLRMRCKQCKHRTAAETSGAEVFDANSGGVEK